MHIQDERLRNELTEMSRRRLSSKVSMAELGRILNPLVDQKYCVQAKHLDIVMAILFQANDADAHFAIRSGVQSALCSDSLKSELMLEYFKARAIAQSFLDETDQQMKFWLAYINSPPHGFDEGFGLVAIWEHLYRSGRFYNLDWVESLTIQTVLSHAGFNFCPDAEKKLANLMQQFERTPLTKPDGKQVEFSPVKLLARIGQAGSDRDWEKFAVGTDRFINMLSYLCIKNMSVQQRAELFVRKHKPEEPCHTD